MSLDVSLLLIDRSILLFASEIHAVRRLEGKSKEAASAHRPSCIVSVLHEQLNLQHLVKFTSDRLTMSNVVSNFQSINSGAESERRLFEKQ